MKPKPPPIPTGYRLLKVGEARPKGYKFGHPRIPVWCNGYSSTRLDKLDFVGGWTYIAPLPKKKSKTKRKP